MAGIQKLNLTEIEQSLEKIADFLVPCLPLANAHATDFITQNHWERLVPKGVQDELLALTQEQLRTLPSVASFHCANTCVVDQDMLADLEAQTEIRQDRTSNVVLNKLDKTEVCQFENHLNTKNTDLSSNKCKIKDNEEEKKLFPYCSIAHFVNEARVCSEEVLGGMVVSSQDLLGSFGGQGDNMFVGTFMNQKKSHEVEIMSTVCAALAKYLKCKLVVDFGSGKGYLGNHLSLQYGIPVLGIDAAQTNTQSAKRRNLVLDKHWEGLTRNKMLEVQGKKLTKKEKKKLKEKMRMNDEAACGDVKKSTGVSGSSGRENEFKDGDDFGPVIETDLREMNKVSGKNVDSLLDYLATANEILDCSKYVPCTTFIDNETNFIKLAQLHFPELFEKLCKDNKTSERSCDEKLFNSIKKTDADEVKNDVTLAANQLNELYLDTETCEFSSDKDKNVFITETMTTANSRCKTFEKSCYNESHVESLKETCNEATDNFNIMLTGLHTCGNLASTSMEVFVHCDELKVMCNVGCCYHLLDEQFPNTAHCMEPHTSKYGFPLSKYMKGRNFQLGITARNLASQSLHRILDFDKLQGERFYPRALLEVLIQDICGQNSIVMKGMRKLEQKCGSTQEYIKKACDKLGLSDKVSSDMIDSYIKQYKDEKQKLAAFFQLKTVLAPCIESLIILDRVCYLLEQEQVKDVFLVKMFDPVISPRCYGIVAIK